MDTENCPLCLSSSAAHLYTDRTQSYYICPVCALIFVPAGFHLSAEEEKARYDLHRNDPEDAGYRAFLSPLVRALLPHLAPGDQGLDFGCGPGPALSAIFAERGFRVANYDPYYAPDPALLDRTYDFVVSTETVEHFCRPADGWGRIVGLVKEGGHLGVMSGLYGAAEGFASWRYKDDPTHVSFYSVRTIEWIASAYALDLLGIEENVAVFRRR